jgi:hypothetical protein
VCKKFKISRRGERLMGPCEEENENRLVDEFSRFGKWKIKKLSIIIYG